MDGNGEPATRCLRYGARFEGEETWDRGPREVDVEYSDGVAAEG